MARKRRDPSVEVRTHRRGDGSLTETWSVRYYDEARVRRRQRCASKEEAEFERARMNLEDAGASPAPVVSTPDEPGGMTLAEFWPAWRDDARGRLARSTFKEYERLWDRRLAPRFGHLPLAAIRPRLVSQWRAELLNSGVGPEAVRYAMVLLQAMFTIAIEWGEAENNPVSVVRKPRQGRQRAVEPITPEGVEHLRGTFLARGDLLSATLVCVLALRRAAAGRGARTGVPPRPREHHPRRARDQRRRAQAPEDGAALPDRRPASGAGRRPCAVSRWPRPRCARLPARRRRPMANRRLEQLAQPPLPSDGQARRPRPSAALRPASFVRLADDPRAAHVDRGTG